MVELMKRTHIDGDLEMQAEYQGTEVRVNLWRSGYPVLCLKLTPEGLELFACAVERIRTRWEESVKQ